MIKWLSVYLVTVGLLVGAWQCFAGNTIVPMTGAGRTGSTYVGPGDVVSGASAWYSCQRAYNAAYATGSNAGCNIRRASDSHACDLLIAQSGSVGNTANCGTGGDNGHSAASFCNATSCFVTKAYDQSGNSLHVLQATSGAQPALTLSCIGSFNCMSSNSIVQLLASSATLGAGLAQPFSVSLIMNNANTNTGNNTIFDCNTGAMQTGQTPGTPAAYIYAGTLQSVADTNSANFTLQGVYNGASSVLSLNGSATTGLNPGAGSCASGKITILACCVAGGNYFNGNFPEGGIWPVAFNSTQYGNLNSNQRSYWGF